MFPFPSTDPSMYPRIAKEQLAGAINRRSLVFCLQKGDRGPPFVFFIAAQFPEMKQCFVRILDGSNLDTADDQTISRFELYNYRICLTLWHRGWSSLFSFSFSEEEYDEEEEEEEYEEEVQTNPDEYDIFFSNHHSLYIRSISNFLPHKIYWDIKGKI